MKRFVFWTPVAAVAIFACTSSPAWDYEGHRLVNQLALSSLPTNFPDFVRAPEAAERVAFLAGEPDRWRNVPDLTLKHCNGPDHYIDLEQLNDYEIKPEALPVFRYDFVGQLAIYRHLHPDKFPADAMGKNEDHTRQLIGFLPWAIAENYAKLKSSFSYLKTFETHGGTEAEIKNAQRDILYVMGVMGHYVGDASQPLHTTIHHHGWIGSNPAHYSTNSRIHSWIDGGFLARCGTDPEKLKSQLRPAQAVKLGERAARPDEMLQAAMQFISEQHRFVEPLYKLEKEGKMSSDPAASTEGKALLEGQLVKSGQYLADLWYSAWDQAPVDTFLERQLSSGKHDSAGTQ